MENDAPTAAGPTPDSEENNNANDKESPGPSTVESTSKDGDANEERTEGSATPKSAGSDVAGETSGDVTVGSAAPEGEAYVAETSENVDAETLGDKTESDREGEPTEAHQDDGQPKDEGEGAKEEGGDGENRTESEGKEDEEAAPSQPVDSVTDGPASESAANETGERSEAVSKEPGPEQENDQENKVEDSGVEETEDTGAKSEDTADAKEGSADEQLQTETVDNVDNIDTVSTLSKVAEPGSKVEEESKQEDGYSADNEATTTAASIDTGEISQSGLVLEQQDSTKSAEGEEPPRDGEGGENDDEVKVQAEEKDEVPETPLSYEELLTKHHATELQLDGLKEDNDELKEKVKRLENEIQQLREGTEQDKMKQRDGYRVQADFLARELTQTQDAEKFLKEKVAELLEEKEEGEKKVKDLQLRLKRFAKDDKAKDERISKLEMELKEITEVIQELESYVDEETRLRIQEKRTSTRQSSVSGQENSHTKATDMNKLNTNRSHRDPEPVQRSRTCVII